VKFLYPVVEGGKVDMIHIGTIVEIEKNKAQILTIDFNSVNINRKPGMYIGQQIKFKDEDLYKTITLKRVILISSGVAAILLIYLSIWSNVPISDKSSIYAYVDLDVNPSIEIALNSEKKVLKARSLNSDAKKVLSAIQINNLDVNEAITIITSKCQELGFMPSQDDIVLISCVLNSVNPEYKKNKTKIEKYFNALFNSICKKDDLSKKVIMVDYDIKKLAMKNSISSGKEIIYLKAKERGFSVTLKSIKKDHMSTSMITNILDNKSENQYDKTPETHITPSNNEITPSPSVNSQKSRIKVMYYNAPTVIGDTKQINPEFQIVNTSQEPINLSQVKLRYYYTIDGEENQNFECFATIGQKNIIAKFVKMKAPKTTANYYLEIGFKDSILPSEGKTQIYTWFNKQSWSLYKVNNDYSYNPLVTSTFYDWNKVTGYVNMKLVWGIEP